MRNEILANRMTTPMMKEKETIHREDEESDCTMQGKEYESQKYKGEDEYRCPKNPDGSCPPVPDMSQYKPLPSLENIETQLKNMQLKQKLQIVKYPLLMHQLKSKLKTRMIF